MSGPSAPSSSGHAFDPTDYGDLSHVFEPRRNKRPRVAKPKFPLETRERALREECAMLREDRFCAELREQEAEEKALTCTPHLDKEAWLLALLM
jgi:hypothetical protein